MQPAATIKAPMASVRDAPDAAGRHDDRAEGERAGGADAADEAGGHRGEQQHEQAARHQAQAGHDHRGAVAVAGLLGGLHVRGGADEAGEQREAEHQRREVGQQDRPAGGRADVHQRGAAPQLDRDQHAGEHDRGGQQSERPGRGPAPGRGLGQRQHEGDQRGGQQSGADEVDPAARLARGLGHDGDRGQEGGRADAGGDPEQDVVVGVFGHDTGEGEPERATDPEHGADQRDGRRHPFARQFGAEQADAEGDRRHGRALDRPADDEQAEVVGEGVEQRARDQRSERDQQHEPLAEHVAEPAEQRYGHRADEQRDGQQPLDVGGRAMQFARQQRQDGDEQGLREGDGQRPDADDQQLDPGPGGRGDPPGVGPARHGGLLSHGGLRR